MEKIFNEVGSLDKKCYEKFALTKDILMEHAANSMKLFIEENFEKGSNILITSGVGNNGADGIALARLLERDFNVVLYIPFEVKSSMAKIQLQRVNCIGVTTQTNINNLPLEVDVVVDCLFGSGLSRDLDESALNIIETMNYIDGYKLACDIPSGINLHGQITKNAFIADTTITMGALKKSLYSDIAKDYIGDIIVADLGVSRELYEGNTDTYLLNEDDFILPLRDTKNTHKGSFGHLAVIVGEKQGAGLLCADAGFNFGAGLVTIIAHHDIQSLPYHIMQAHQLPSNTTAIAIGMGLGNYEKNEIDEILTNDIPKVIDADLFYSEDIIKVLEFDNIVLTPHPKEFCTLLKICEIADIDIDTLQNNRFEYVEKFCNKYPNVVLLLKGANVIIAQDREQFINPHGSSILSFGGSGDVLSGLIASLLAQGYSPINAAINGSLALTLGAKNYTFNNYALSPQELINEVKKI
jgi:hydroxyethylthiazole kinase-like uncharacterized protein yjeF